MMKSGKKGKNSKKLGKSSIKNAKVRGKMLLKVWKVGGNGKKR